MISGDVWKVRPLTDEEITTVITQDIMWGRSADNFFDLSQDPEELRDSAWGRIWTELAAFGCDELFRKLENVFFLSFNQLNRLDRLDELWKTADFGWCYSVLCHSIKWRLDRNPLDSLALWMKCGLDLLRGANEFNPHLWAKLYRLNEITQTQVVQAALYANCDAENIAPQLLAFLEETGTATDVLPFLERISRSKVEHHANFGQSMLKLLGVE